jgi:hypothetical protein
MEIHHEARRDMVERKARYMPIDRWREYETEKRKIAARNLPPLEYSAEIKKLCERLKL